MILAFQMKKTPCDETCKQANKLTIKKSKWEKQIKHEARKQNAVIKQINENKNKQTQTQNK